MKKLDGITYIKISNYRTRSNIRPLSNNRTSSKIQIEDPLIKQDCNNKRPSLIQDPIIPASAYHSLEQGQG